MELGRWLAMPQQAWNAKRERQYEHIKEGLRQRGRSEDTAEEIAARTVNKERARAGESARSSRTSREDISSVRRGGLRSHRGPGGRTKEQLYNEAKARNIPGRSKMRKADLARAVGRGRARPGPRQARRRRRGREPGALPRVPPARQRVAARSLPAARGRRGWAEGAPPAKPSLAL